MCLVGAAFWLKESDSGHWYLYIASDRLRSTADKIAERALAKCFG